MNKEYTLEEFCQLVDISKRTVRYYIQLGLIPRPEGKNKGARYLSEHLERAMEIKKWQAAGLSLERIAELLEEPELADVPLNKPKPGDIELWSRLIIDNGLQLHIEPSQCGLNSDQTRELANKVMAAYQHILEKGNA